MKPFLLSAMRLPCNQIFYIFNLVEQAYKPIFPFTYPITLQARRLHAAVLIPAPPDSLTFPRNLIYIERCAQSK